MKTHVVTREQITEFFGVGPDRVVAGSIVPCVVETGNGHPCHAIEYRKITGGEPVHGGLPTETVQILVKETN